MDLLKISLQYILAREAMFQKYIHINNLYLFHLENVLKNDIKQAHIFPICGQSDPIWSQL